MSGIFESCNIYLSTVSNKSVISKQIKDNGGSVSFMLTKTVTHFITDEKEVQTESFNWKKAKDYNLPIVSEAFITESVQQNKRLLEADYGFENVKKIKAFSFFDSPAKSPVKSTNSPTPTSTSSYSSYSSSTESTLPSLASLSISSPHEKKPAVKAPVKLVAPAVKKASSYSIPIEPSYSEPSYSEPTYTSTTSYTTPIAALGSASKSTIEIKKNPRNIPMPKLFEIKDSRQPPFSTPFEVLVSNTLQLASFSGSSSNNKFYHIELQKDKNGQHRVYTSYGRTDGPKTNEARYCDNLEDSIDIYSKIYNEKTSEKKGYKPVKLDSSSVSSNPTNGPSASSITAASTLTPVVSQLVQTLYNEATTQLTNSFNVNITERGIETPLGVLSMEQVEQGERALENIHQYLKKTGAPSTVELERLSSEFFTIIPHKMGRGRDVVANNTIKNLDQLNSKVELLQLMKDLLVVKVSGTGTHALDMKYRALKTELSPLGQFSLDYSQVKNLIKNTAGGSLDIHNIYQIKKHGDIDSSDLEPKPTQLLLHGSRASNFVGILSRGMLLPKVIVNNGGSRTDFGFLGAGIYYGDSFDTSLKYAHPAMSNNRRYVLVSRVALGQISKHTKINATLTQPPTGYDSCLGVKGNTLLKSDFNDNEYVIYNLNQQKQEYLVEFTYTNSNLPSSGLASSTLSSFTSLTKPQQPPIGFSKKVEEECEIVLEEHDDDDNYVYQTKPVYGGGRTKQTARVSTGGKAPIYRPSIKSAPGLDDSELQHNFNNISLSEPQVPTIPVTGRTKQTARSSTGGKVPVYQSTSLSKTSDDEFIASFEDISISDKSIYEDDPHESQYRKLFATNRNDSRLNDKFLHCNKVFSPIAPYKSIPINGVDCIMGFNATKKQFVNSQNEFETAWGKFSGNMFDGFNWNNVFIAGGSILGCSLVDGTEEGKGFEKSDIDVFLYGLTETEATRKLNEIEQFIKTKSPNTQMARTKYAVTFVSGAPFRNVQVVLRIYKSPAEVLMGFDIDCCSIGFDGSNVYAVPRAMKAVSSSCNIVSMSRRSLTYETRLFKYAIRGFAIKVPNFDKRTVPGSITSLDIKGTTGLLRLLLLEFKYVSNSSFISMYLGDSDYSEIEIPSGQYWSVNSAVNFINYKEKGQFFAKKKLGFKHCHLIVVGDQAKYGKASWCKKCMAGEEPEDSTTQDVVTGEMKWITENPGQQILTGSFHPVNDNDWYNLPTASSNNKQQVKDINYYKLRIINNLDVSDIPDFSPKSSSNIGCKFLLDSNHLLCIAAGYGSNVSLKSMIHVYKQYINVADEQGFYPIHYVSKSGNLECLELLLQNNASAVLRTSNYRFSCGMVSKYYDTNPTFERITRAQPRIWNIKCNLPPYQYIYRWNQLGSASKQEPTIYNSYLLPTQYSYSTKALFQAIHDGNIELLKTFLNNPQFKESFDPIRNSLFHYAVLSPYPEVIFNLLKSKGLSPNTTPNNIFGQSILLFAKSTIGTIKTWTRNHPSCGNIPFSSIYLHEQLSKIIKDLSNNNNNNNNNTNNDFISRVPLDFINKYVKDETQQQFNQQKSVPLQPSYTFGFGGKFAPMTKPTIPSYPTATPSYPTTQMNPVSPYNLPPSPQMVGNLSPSSFSSNGFSSSSSFGFQDIASNGSPPLTGYYFDSQPNPPVQMLPQSLKGLAGNSLSTALSNRGVSPNLDSAEFLASSLVAQALVIIELVSASGKLPKDRAIKAKALLMSVHLPVFNCFEAYLLNRNEDAFVENVNLVIERYDQQQKKSQLY